MNMMRRLKPLFAPAAQHELAAHFDPVAIRSLLDEALDDYEVQRPDLPREATAGGQMTVHLAAVTIGFYRALLGRGVSEEDAKSLTAGVTGRVYNTMATLPTVLSKVGVGSKVGRVKRATDLIRRFPFTPPSYDMVDVAGGPDVVAFDVHRCPIAEYFRAQDLGELCVESWCNLDYPLAERWGARLERSQTIAGGSGHCDFRWRVPPVEESQG